MQSVKWYTHCVCSKQNPFWFDMQPTYVLWKLTVCDLLMKHAVKYADICFWNLFAVHWTNERYGIASRHSQYKITFAAHAYECDGRTIQMHMSYSLSRECEFRVVVIQNVTVNLCACVYATGFNCLMQQKRLNYWLWKIHYNPKYRNLHKWAQCCCSKRNILLDV